MIDFRNTFFYKNYETNSSAETDMNGSSHPDQENLLLTIDSRLRASARHGGAGSCFEFCPLIRCGGVLSGAAAIIVSEGESCNNPRIISG